MLEMQKQGALSFFELRSDTFSQLQHLRELIMWLMSDQGTTLQKRVWQCP